MAARYFRSRPQEVEAIQWTGDNLDQILDFTGPLRVTWDERPTSRGPAWELKLWAGQDGAQGWVPVPLGHWIVRKLGDLSDHWPVDPAYFASKYEEVGP